MKRAFKIGAVFLAVMLGGFVALAVIMGILDEPRTHYATYRDADTAGVFARQYLAPPGWIPQSAIDISETRNIDIGHRWIRFRAPVGDLRLALADQEQISVAQARAATGYFTSRAPAPPRHLTDRNFAPPDSITIYRRVARSDTTCVHVDWRTGEAYIWSCLSAT